MNSTPDSHYKALSLPSLPAYVRPILSFPNAAHLMNHLPVLLLLLVTLSSCKSGSGVITEHPGQAATLSDELKVEELRAGAWVHSSFRNTESFGRVLSNGLVVTSGDEALLIDTGWSSDSEATTRELLEEVHKSSGARVVRSVFTHYHDDSVGGINALRQGNIPTYATTATANFMDVNGWGRPDSLLAIEDDVNVWRLSYGDHHIEVYYPGPGHTVDNVVIYVPHTRVLYGGCLIRPGTSKSLGNTADAIVGRWAESVALVRERYGDRVDIVIPSHGKPGGSELLDHTIELVESNRNRSVGG